MAPKVQAAGSGIAQMASAGSEMRQSAPDAPERNDTVLDLSRSDGPRADQAGEEAARKDLRGTLSVLTNPAMRASVKGHVDGLDKNGRVTGWAYVPESLSKRVTVAILDDGEEVV